MAFDPTQPADHSPLQSALMRSQLTGLQSNITTATADKVTQTQLNSAMADKVSQAQLAADLATAIAGTARNPSNVSAPSFSFSNPPTDGELYAVQSWLNDLYNALVRSP